MELDQAVKLGIAFIIGAIIGIERQRSESDQKKGQEEDTYPTLGLRTFSLIALLGGVAGLLVNQYLLLTIFVSVLFGVLLTVFYIFHSIYSKDIGITTEISLVYAYLIGLLISIEILPIQLILAISVVLLIVLSKKEQIKKAVGFIRSNEMNAFTSYALISFVVLPFLPNTSITLSDIPYFQTLFTAFNIDVSNFSKIELINPFKLWFIVALITGVDLLGHILERTLGQHKGWILTSITGGFVSSTATTQTLAQQSKGLTQVNHLVAAAIFSNLASFFQIGFLIIALSVPFFIKSSVVLLFMILSALAVGIYFLRTKEDVDTAIENTKQVLKSGQIINLIPALKFALLFSVIRVFSQLSIQLFGNSGFIVASTLGALTGLDAVIINAAELAGKSIDYNTAVMALILANAVNLISKSVYSFLQGSPDFAKKFAISTAIIITSSALGLLFLG